MARPKAQMPALRYHISGNAVVTLDGRDFYLGKHGTAESLARYAVLIGIYQRGGLSLPKDITVAAIDSHVSSLLGEPTQVTESNQSQTPILVRHVTAAYRDFARGAYASSRSELFRIECLCDELDKHNGNTLASDYGPRLLRAQRDRWVKSGKSRTYCNRLTCLTVRIFKWAVSEELVTESTWSRLRSLEPLKLGQTEAPEREPTKPVALDIVRATAKELPPVLKAMVRVHLATGMRPTELCTIRPIDIDRTGDEWIYRPENHKNKAKGKTRAIPILGDAREAITDYLNRDPQSYCFSPAESVAWWQAAKRAARKSKVQPSQISRAVENPQREPGDHYTQESYRRAIARACVRAGVAKWHPYQLRHLNLTQVRDALGVEFAQAIGGHSRVDMTEVYAKLSEAKAVEAARHAPTLGNQASIGP